MHMTPQDLYSETPPTKMRNRKEVFRVPRNIPFWNWVADRALFSMLENRFFSLMVKGAENFEKRDKRFATIMYAPHSNWWDGILSYNLERRVLHIKKFRMMIEEMNRFPLFQLIGAYPINKKSAQTAMEALRYTVDHILDDNEKVVHIFPQGIVRPPHFRPEKFQTGLAYMIDKAVKKYGGVNLVPYSAYYCFLREDKPEILVEYDMPKVITEYGFDRKEFTEKLAKDFEEFCDRQLENVARANFEGYEYVYKKPLSWWKHIERYLKNIGMKKAKKQSEKTEK